MFERYRPEQLREVSRFARRLDNFFYVKLIIDAHSKGKPPGECFVWREDGRIAAFSAVAWLNRDDAWLWGMRVDRELHDRGIGTRFTRALFPLIRRTGRTWAGLNTRDSDKPKATFRVMEKLGMKLEDTYADDVYWRRPRGVMRPRLKPFRDIFSHFVGLGRRTFFYQQQGWLCCRLLPSRRAWVNRGGRMLDGVPLHVARDRYTEKGRRYGRVTVNLFDRPTEFGEFVPRLLALAPRRGHMVVNYPAEWKDELRRAARAAVPRLRQNQGAWFSAWRIYGRKL